MGEEEEGGDGARRARDSVLFEAITEGRDQRVRTWDCEDGVLGDGNRTDLGSSR